MIKVGNLVQYVGNAKTYWGRVGAVTKVYATPNMTASNCALVYYPNAYGLGRDGRGLGQTTNGLHPMGFDELVVVA